MRTKVGIHTTEELRAMITAKQPGTGTQLRGIRVFGLHCIAYGYLAITDTEARNETLAKAIWDEKRPERRAAKAAKSGASARKQAIPGIQNPFGDDVVAFEDVTPVKRTVTRKPDLSALTNDRVPARAGEGTRESKAVDLAKRLLEIAEGGKGEIDEEKVREIAKQAVSEAIADGLGRYVYIESPLAPPVTMTGDTLHPLFETVYRVMQCRLAHTVKPEHPGEAINLFLTGPKGSGKSTLAKQVADALGLRFASIACNVETPVSRFIGAVSPLDGTYHDAPCVNFYEHGGLFLSDEFDRLDGAVATVLNGLLANDFFTLPDGRVIQKHPDFRFIATGNTFGSGADNLNVDAQQLGEATLDRFFYLTAGYDWSLTAKLIGLDDAETLPVELPGDCSKEEWYSFCKKASKACDALGAAFRHTVGPRAVIYGNALLRAVSRKQLEDGLVYRGLNEAKRRQLDAKMEGM